MVQKTPPLGNYKLNTYITRSIKRKREYKIESCHYKGINCLNTFLKLHKKQIMCQRCGVECGIYKEEADHFRHTAQGTFRKFQSGNPKGKQKGVKWTIKQKLLIRLKRTT